VTVYLVGAGPGDPGLLTCRGAALLAAADVVVYDRLVDRSILELVHPRARRIDAGRHPDDVISGAARQAQVNAVLLEWGRRVATVVRLKGGDPFVFGRGGEEMEALRAGGVPCEVVPGVTSAFSVPALAGVPVTHRGLSTSVTVVTGQVGDGRGGGVEWSVLGRIDGTLVVLMGVANRARIARALVDAGRDPETPVLAVEWGSTPAERTVRTTLGDLGATEIANPAVLVVGPVAGLDLGPGGPGGPQSSATAQPAPARPLAGRSIVLTRERGRNEPLGSALRAAGAGVLEVPTTVTEPPDDQGALATAAATVRDVDWVLFTSATAVHRFMGEMEDLRALGGVRLGVVGRATAQALAGYRLRPDLVPDEQRAEGLLDALTATGQVGRALFPRARDARRVLPEGLAAHGWTVDEVEAYATVPSPSPGAGLLAHIVGADAVVFSAPSAVESWAGWRDDRGGSVPVPPVVVCIGPTTADAVRRAGWSVAAQATDPSPEAVRATLVRALGRAVGPGREPAAERTVGSGG